MVEEASDGSSATSRRWAAIGFAVAAVASVPLLFHQGREQWFFLDEWVILHGRDATLADLVRPHNEHLIAIPVLIYRTLFALVGIRAYWPYQAVLIAAHLLSAALLRLVMLRVGVRPWVATIVAASFLVFGAGRQDILWAFQISFTGALALGLGQMLLADHPGQVRWRDALAVLCGIGAVLTSAVGVLMVGAVGLAIVVRRGWAAAAVQVVPPALLWTTWWWFEGRDAVGESAGAGEAVDYARRGLGHALSGLAPWGWVTALTLVVGIALTIRQVGVRAFPKRFAAPIALVLVGIGFLAVTGFARGGRTDSDFPEATRYVYLTAAMMLPMLAVAIDRIVDRSRVAGAVALLAIVAAVPGNIDLLRPHGREVFTVGDPETVLVAAHLPAMQQLPAERQPFGLFEGGITAGWLREALADGKVPPPPEISDRARATMELELSLTPAILAAPVDSSTCTPTTGPVDRRLERGGLLVFEGDPLQIRLRRGDVLSDPVVFAGQGTQRLRALAGPLDLQLQPPEGGSTRLC